jgi:hypothetical protein
MTRNPFKDGNLSESAFGIGTVTRKMVRGRAEDLAMINGDWLHEVAASDSDPGRRVAGEADIAREEASLESVPESERWDPVPGSTGHKVLVACNEDEDDEGRSDNERLVEQGVAEAAHDHMLQASRESAGTDSREA